MTICDGNVSREEVNTRNVNNVCIEIDHDVERDHHNECLSDLLKNHEQYESLLKKECKRLTEIQEMPIIDKTMHPVSLKSYTKQAFQNWMKLLRK